MTILWFSDSPGLTELRKAVLLPVMVYYGRRVQTKVSEGKGFIGWRNQEICLCSFQLSSLRSDTDSS